MAHHKAQAVIKENEARVSTDTTAELLKTHIIQRPDEYFKGTMIQYKIWKEMDLLSQRFNLGSADLKLKAQVFESKELKNALDTILLEWQRDARITPEHIYRGLLLLMSKLF